MKLSLTHPIHFIATGFGAGLLKPAPGTWGTLVGLVIAILLWHLTACSPFFFILTLISFVSGCYICGKCSEDIGIHDDERIVWDEISAIFFLFTLLPEYNYFYFISTFIIFRGFDILKPYPIRYFDNTLRNGFGIMIDDILAAIYTLILIYIIYWSL